LRGVEKPCELKGLRKRKKPAGKKLKRKLRHCAKKTRAHEGIVVLPGGNAGKIVSAWRGSFTQIGGRSRKAWEGERGRRRPSEDGNKKRIG